MKRTHSILFTKRILSYEWIVNGKTAPSPNKDQQVVVFLHGLLGSGKNLRAPAKLLTERQKNIQALLIDSRGHGKSSSFHPPHSIKNSALDVIETMHHLDLKHSASPVGIVGHSYGGRVALEYLYLLSTNEHGNNNVKLPKKTWILDSNPGKAHSSVENVLHAVSSVPTPIANKKDLVSFLTGEKKISPDIASWMTTNLKGSAKSGYDFTFDLNVANSLVKDFDNQEYISYLHNIPRANNYDGNSKVHIVRAGKNSSWNSDVLRQLNEVDSSFLNMHVLEDAGHWVHVDDLEGLLQLIEKGFTE